MRAYRAPSAWRQARRRPFLGVLRVRRARHLQVPRASRYRAYALLRTQVRLLPPLLVAPLYVPARLNRRVIKRRIDAPPVPRIVPPTVRYIPRFGPRGADDGTLGRIGGILPIFLGGARQGTYHDHCCRQSHYRSRQEDALQDPLLHFSALLRVGVFWAHRVSSGASLTLV